jgi:hypothetical protein
MNPNLDQNNSSNPLKKYSFLRRTLVASSMALAFALAAPQKVDAQIYVSSDQNDTVTQYNVNGTNPTPDVTAAQDNNGGVGGTSGLALLGTNLYIANQNNGDISVYHTSTQSYNPTSKRNRLPLILSK